LSIVAIEFSNADADFLFAWLYARLTARASTLET